MWEWLLIGGAGYAAYRYFTKRTPNDNNSDALNLQNRIASEKELGKEFIQIIENILKPYIKEQIRISFDKNQDRFEIFGDYDWKRLYVSAGGPDGSVNRDRPFSNNEKMRMMLTAFNMACYDLQVQKSAVSLDFDKNNLTPKRVSISWKNMRSTSKDSQWQEHYKDLYRDPLSFISDRY